MDYTSKWNLRELLLSVGRGERYLERLRQDICWIYDFSPASAFNRLDREGAGLVGAKEIRDFLNDHHCGHSATPHEVSLLVQYYDLNGDGLLSPEEFNSMIFPCENDDLKQRAIDRQPIELKDEKAVLPCSHERSLINIIIEEIRLLRDVNSRKKYLHAGKDYSDEAAWWSLIDHDNSEEDAKIDRDVLRKFVRGGHCHCICESEVAAIQRRIAVSQDQSIDQAAWNQFLAPVAPDFDWDKLISLTKVKEGREHDNYSCWRMDLKKADENGNSLLQAYIELSEEGIDGDAIALILNAGVDVNHKDNEGKTALFNVAQRSNDHDLFRSLVCRGADLSAVVNEEDIASFYVREQEAGEREVKDETLLFFNDWGLKDVKNEETKKKIDELLDARK